MKKKNATEVGNIFKLGIGYSTPFGLEFQTQDGKKKPVVMGCYGIGLGRLMAAVVDINNDKNGIIWPKEISPFEIHLIQVENNQNVKKRAEKIYQDLLKKGFDVLYDDRENATPGEKFAEADLIGIPYRIVISQRGLKNDNVEVKERDKKKVKLVKIKNLSQFNDIQKIY